MTRHCGHCDGGNLSTGRTRGCHLMKLKCWLRSPLWSGIWSPPNSTAKGCQSMPIPPSGWYPLMIRRTIVPVWGKATNQLDFMDWTCSASTIAYNRILCSRRPFSTNWRDFLKRNEISWHPVLCEVQAASVVSAKNFESSANIKIIIIIHLLKEKSVLQNSHLPPSCKTKTAQLRRHTQLHEALVQILCNTWGASRDNANRGVQSLRGELSVVRWGEVSFADVGWFWKSFGKP